MNMTKYFVGKILGGIVVLGGMTAAWSSLLPPPPPAPPGPPRMGRTGVPIPPPPPPPLGFHMKATTTVCAADGLILGRSSLRPATQGASGRMKGGTKGDAETTFQEVVRGFFEARETYKNNNKDASFPLTLELLGHPKIRPFLKDSRLLKRWGQEVQIKGGETLTYGTKLIRTIQGKEPLFISRYRLRKTDEEKVTLLVEDFTELCETRDPLPPQKEGAAASGTAFETIPPRKLDENKRAITQVLANVVPAALLDLPLVKRTIGQTGEESMAWGWKAPLPPPPPPPTGSPSAIATASVSAAKAPIVLPQPPLAPLEFSLFDVVDFQELPEPKGELTGQGQ